jgi:hypothetical protein
MSRLMTRNDVLDLLNTHIKQAGSVSAAARILAKKSRRPITQQMIEPVLAGRRGFGPTLLRALGLRKVVGYEHVPASGRRRRRRLSET